VAAPLEEVTATTTASAPARPRIPVPSSIRLGGGGCQESRAGAAAARQGQRWGSRSACRQPGPAHRRRRDASTPSLRALFLRAVDPSRPSPWSPAVADFLSPVTPPTRWSPSPPPSAPTPPRFF
jgi:hypothetical protein